MRTPLRVFVLLLMAALCACTRVGAGRSASHPAELRLTTSSDLPTLDPLVSDNANLGYLAPLFHGYLIRVDADGRFIPDLVVRVPSRANGGISADGRTIRYALRRGVRWQDGVPFEARDVVFSFHAAMNPRNDVPDHSGFDDIASARATGPYAVEVRLRRPYSPGVATFFNLGANDAYPILPAHLLARYPDLNNVPYNGAPVGLGPYKVVSWRRGSEIDFQADPHYFQGAPRIARIRLQVVPDQNTSLTLWRSGASDMTLVSGFGATTGILQQVESRPRTRTRLRDHYQFDYVMFNVASARLRDQAVRRALVRGIDRQRIMHDLMGSLYRAGDGDRLPGQFAYDPAIVQPPYDLAKAKALLDAAGWGPRADGFRYRNGSPLTLEIVGVAGSRASEQFDVRLQGELARLGIRAEVKSYQYSLLFLPYQEGGIFARGEYDLAFYGWQPGEDQDHSYLFRCDSRPPGGENYSFICDPVIDRAARVELSSNDPVAQARADREILRRLIDRSDLLFLGFTRDAVATRDDLEGVEPSVLGQHLWNAWEWRWSPAQSSPGR
ncbi:peptide ABC transporter substrate-binding protein [bacterium]|nr:MAG: peptide ABC transporter substrate-binding protein [bacterium]